MMSRRLRPARRRPSAAVVVPRQTKIIQLDSVLAAVLDLDLEGARGSRSIYSRKSISFGVVVPIFAVMLPALGRRHGGIIRLITV